MERRKGSRLLQTCLNMRRQLNRLIENGELSRGEYLVLRCVWVLDSDFEHRRAGNVRAAELSDMLDLSRPSVTRILNALERRGFISRDIDSRDRRGVVIELTTAGLRAVEKANRRLLDIAERVVESLGESDTDKLIELMDRLAEIYRQML